MSVKLVRMSVVKQFDYFKIIKQGTSAQRLKKKKLAGLTKTIMNMRSFLCAKAQTKVETWSGSFSDRTLVLLSSVKSQQMRTGLPSGLPLPSAVLSSLLFLLVLLSWEVLFFFFWGLLLSCNWMSSGRGFCSSSLKPVSTPLSSCSSWKVQSRWHNAFLKFLLQ